MDQETRIVLLGLMKALSSLTQAFILTLEVGEENPTGTAIYNAVMESGKQLRDAAEILGGKNEPA